METKTRTCPRAAEQCRAGGECGRGIRSSAKGVQGYPYVGYVWAYDVNDLLSVKADRKLPWQVTPYAVWSLPELGNYALGGATMDPETGQVFISQLGGDGGDLPLIQVFRVQVP